MSFVKSLQIYLDKLSPVGFHLFLLLSGCLAALTRWNLEFVPTDFLWAEDAVIFLKDALENGARSLWLPYNGYLHSLLRISALAAASIDYIWVPTIFFATWVFGFLAMLFTTHRFLRQLDIPRTAILSACILVVLQPHSGEVFFNLTNLQWLLGLSLALLILSEPDSLTPWLQIPLVAVLSLTGPFSILLAGVVLARAVLRRQVTAAELILMALATTQLAVVLHSGRGGTTPTDPSALHWLSAFATFFTFGSQYFFVQCAGIAFWAFLLRQLWKMPWFPQESSKDDILHMRTLQLLAFGTLTFGASLWAVKDIPDVITPLKDGARYFFVPYAVAIICFVIFAHKIQKARVLIWLMILVPTVAHIGRVNFSVSHFRAFQAFAAIHTGVIIPVQPPGWRIELPQHKFADNYTALRKEISPYRNLTKETRQDRQKYEVVLPVAKDCYSASFIGIEANFRRQIISSAELTSSDWPAFRSNGTFHDRQKPIEKLQFAMTLDRPLRQLLLTLSGQELALSPQVTMFCIWRK